MISAQLSPSSSQVDSVEYGSRGWSGQGGQWSYASENIQYLR